MNSNDNKVGIIMQARMGSTRLPAKIMMPINNKPILKYQIERMRGLKYPIYIATTTKPQDDIIEKFAVTNNLLCFRGDEDNVLKRYYDCAHYYNLNTIVRVTSDCPLIDADIINEGVKQYLAANNQKLFLSNTLERTFPRGADFEIFSFLQLKNAHEKAIEKSDIEHVTPYIFKNKIDGVDVIQFKQNHDFSAFRLTLDTSEDFTLIRLLIEAYKAHQLNMKEICEILISNPDLPRINSHVEQKK